MTIWPIWLSTTVRHVSAQQNRSKNQVRQEVNRATSAQRPEGKNNPTTNQRVVAEPTGPPKHVPKTDDSCDFLILDVSSPLPDYTRLQSSCL